ncbi:MAG: hypothetical protein AAGF89_15610 [Bacteroidota bacterium]
MVVRQSNIAVLWPTFCLLFFLLLGGSFWAQAQDAVSVLKAKTMVGNAAVNDAAEGTLQAFTFARNLIFFPAQVNGQKGNFILDTGAPTLLLNNRGVDDGFSTSLGVASGGAVALTNQRVESFQMAGEDHGRIWALTLDLRSLEARMNQEIDGFVGHEMLRNGELRIDYPNRTFQLRKSTRFPLNEGAAPRMVFRIEFVDHLPVITLKSGKRKLRFAIDTGAGANLIDARHAGLLEDTGTKMNIQGLDGTNADYSIVRLLQKPSEFTDAAALQFLSLDLSHLQNPQETLIDGLLGSAFLSKYIVGIDYRRRRLYLW